MSQYMISRASSPAGLLPALGEEVIEVYYPLNVNETGAVKLIISWKDYPQT